ncbi:MAG: formimidoylglutamase [Chitinophagales bacterium]
MFEEFLQQAPAELLAGENYSENQLGLNVISDLNPEGMQIALVGVKEDRGSVKNNGCAEAPDLIRRELFSRSKISSDTKIIDLGNIEMGETIRDTYVALSKVVNELIHLKVLPVIIGGSHDLTFGQFGAYHDLNRIINMTVADNTIDLKAEQPEMDDEGFLLNTLSYEPSYIFNFNQIGYQTHLTSQSAVELLDKLHFDSYRLGKVKSAIEEMEPVLRGTNLFSFDMSVIRYSDSPGNRNATPNGLFAEEACQLASYAGQGEKVDSFGIYGCNPSVDVRGQSVQLAADIIWYFLNGFYNRKNDYPKEDDPDYVKFTIHFKENKYEMNFWKSKKTDRWWMEVPGGNKPRNQKKFHLLPCSYNDYQMACREELPERWIKAYQKLS